MAIRAQRRPPWTEDGQPERWITVEEFARIVRRSPKTVYQWLQAGNVLPSFGYRAYHDPLNRWRIQVGPADLELLKRLV